MSYRTTEADDIDHAPDTEREDELVRSARWDTFVDWLKREYAHDRGWPGLIIEAGRDMRTNPPSAFVDFAYTEGWHGVLNAIARAMLEAEDVNRTDPRR